MEPGFYEVTAIGAGVGEGVTGSRYCHLGGILKTDSSEAPYTVANELVASRLAGLLGLPVPPGTVVSLADGTMAYAMLRFGLAGESPPPVNVSQFVLNRSKLAAGIVLFDAWILNADRHAGNIAYVPPSRDLVSVFDHGHALLGTWENKATEYMRANLDTHALGYGCIISQLSHTKDLEEWIQAIQGVRDAAIKEVCRPLSGLGLCTKDERDVLVSFLVHRKKTLRDLVQQGRGAFAGIADGDWGLV